MNDKVSRDLIEMSRHHFIHVQLNERVLRTSNSALSYVTANLYFLVCFSHPKIRVVMHRNLQEILQEQRDVHHYIIIETDVQGL